MIYFLLVSNPLMQLNPDYMLLFSSWYLTLDSGDLLVDVDINSGTFCISSSLSDFGTLVQTSLNVLSTEIL